MLQSRRAFLEFLGKAGLMAQIAPGFLLSYGNSNNILTEKKLSEGELEKLRKLPLASLSPTDEDNLVLADGLSSEVLIRFGAKINSKEEFGFNNDFLCFIPLDEEGKRGLIWVNHEYAHTLFVSGYNYHLEDAVRNKEQVTKEMQAVGGSIIEVRLKENNQWDWVRDSKYNRRISGHTPIPFNWNEKLAGKKEAIGTNSNCSGGITPWGTVLTCEENYDSCFGETVHEAEGISHRDSFMGWEKYYPYPPEHYGWVVEIDPKTGKAQKHVALGRFAHECCTLKQLDDGRVVAYTGDDKNDEFIYKFISSKKNSLKEGTLYVADTDNGVWLSLDYDSNADLQKHFKDQTEVLIRCREAARLIGATPQNRPEDIEIDPLNGNIIVALTNNKARNDFHGSLLKITEKDGRYDALEFESEALIVGGEENGFSCPDNLVFDYSGNLWFTSDISGSSMNRPDKPYMAFKNNGLFVMIRHGEKAGKVIQIASAPTDAEFTGPWFSPDYKTLFLSVQHPGENSLSLEQLTSHWPFDEDGIPKPSVVCIQGELLDKLNHLNKL
jgi:secreted PhoX family phosphatase